MKQLRKKAVSEVTIYILEKILELLLNLNLEVKQLNEKKAVSEVVDNFL